MTDAPQPVLAELDRTVLSDAQEPSSAPISQLGATPRWILLGEPGSGKSTVFGQEAQREGSVTVTARDFVEGCRPEGSTAFIDAVEEYRIGEPGRDRWLALIAALEESPYAKWRLACRAISLPPPDLAVLRRRLGDVEVWTLDQLQRNEQVTVLRAMGETDPEGLVERLEAMGSEALLGNPATIRLVVSALKTPGPAMHTRGEVFERAVEAMAYEVNEELPERPERPSRAAILNAAERACLVLMMSARGDLWLHQSMPPAGTVVTRDDLLPAEVDTEALRFAVDTPLFRGEGGRFTPTHRTVAEFLAGRGLANAVNRSSGSPPALPLRRALALLSGADGRPAPALAGTFAWFASMLARGPHADTAAVLIEAHPELILSQGDPGLLPVRHKRLLLAATGRNDPWFLQALRGSSAVGGLAASDVAPELEAILLDKTDTPNRRLLALEALRLGRPMPELLDSVEAIAGDDQEPEWLRRRAIAVLIGRAGDPEVRLRRLADGLGSDASPEGVAVRLAVVEGLVGRGATAVEVREVLAAYAATGDGVMGYARDLGMALEHAPPADLFEGPLPGYRKTVGRARSFEIASIVQQVLSAEIRRESATLTPQRLLRWLANAGLKPSADPERPVSEAIAFWIGAGRDRDVALFESLVSRSHRQAWQTQLELMRLTGAAPTSAVLDLVLKRLEDAATAEDTGYYADLATRLISSSEKDAALYWRLWSLLADRPGFEDLFKALSQSSIDDWRSKEAKRKRQQEASTARTLDADRMWLTGHQAELASGAAIPVLAAAARLYAGWNDDVTTGTGWERVRHWAGEALAQQIDMGWRAVVDAFATSPEELAEAQISRTTRYDATICAIWMAAEFEHGREPQAFSPEAALAALSGRIYLSGDARQFVGRACTARLVRDASALEMLQRFWARTLSRGGDDPLPHGSEFSDIPAVGPIVAGLLGAEPDRPPAVLRTVLPLLVGTLPTGALTALVATALASPLRPEASAMWTYVGFMIDPAAYEPAFTRIIDRIDVQALLDQLHNAALVAALTTHTANRVHRDRVLVKLLAPRFPPTESCADHRDIMSQAVAAAVDRLGKTPASEASAALAELIEKLKVSPWINLLRHQSAAQANLRSEAEFKAPTPLAVSVALAAGRPATARDLQAVVSEILDALSLDIRTADTSPWKGFWNHPDDPDCRSPKIENDCRDLLTDRLRDRLIRFGLTANKAAPEARSGNERRVDLLLIGEDIAALPLEAKRHLNPEIWTAPLDQLAPYSASAKSAGRAVYLIFWFGVEAGSVPKRPKGTDLSSADLLRDEIRKSLSPEMRELIDVVVMDVSPPSKMEDASSAAVRPKRRRTAKNVPASPAAKTRGTRRARSADQGS